MTGLELLMLCAVGVFAIGVLFFCIALWCMSQPNQKRK